MGVSILFLPRLYVISQTVVWMHSVCTYLATQNGGSHALSSTAVCNQSQWYVCTQCALGSTKWGFQALSSMAVCNQTVVCIDSVYTWLHQMRVSRLFLPRLYVIRQWYECTQCALTWLHQMGVSRLFLPRLYVFRQWCVCMHSVCTWLFYCKIRFSCGFFIDPDGVNTPSHFNDVLVLYMYS